MNHCALKMSWGFLLASGQLHDLTNYNLPWLHWDSLVTWDRAMESPRSVRLSRTQACVLLAIGFPPVLCSGCIGVLFLVQQQVMPVQYHNFPHEMKLTQLVASEKINLSWEGYPWRNEMFTKPTPSSHNEYNFTTNFGDGVGVRYSGVWCNNNPNELGYMFFSCK